MLTWEQWIQTEVQIGEKEKKTFSKPKGKISTNKFSLPASTDGYNISGENINLSKSIGITTCRLLARIWNVDAQNMLRICSNEQFITHNVKNKTIFHEMWSSTGCLDTHLAKSPSKTVPFANIVSCCIIIIQQLTMYTHVQVHFDQQKRFLVV